MNRNPQEALFAAGCFWGVQEHFAKLDGVRDTQAGYTGGDMPYPDYKSVCSGRTMHAETVRIVFDPEKIGYDELLDEFWKCHDPTQLNRQGWDVGTQYRSAIFTTSQEQEAQALKAKQNAQAKFSRPIRTRIEQAAKFWPAEEYHQHYIAKNKGGEYARHSRNGDTENARASGKDRKIPAQARPAIPESMTGSIPSDPMVRCHLLSESLPKTISSS